ncbi:hypothetical protein D9758_003446 [Tetrapyrgos nigripes]|uniref:Uncharacterized protein n=1 Tax=Tetrapyrgos nigripes TaxID=182062 RepID=A0A8H5GV08_9AGAR|nr:hypothetical protein D9758_003446 [Tetrapyrgos nigripes]
MTLSITLLSKASLLFLLSMVVFTMASPLPFPLAKRAEGQDLDLSKRYISDWKRAEGEDEDITRRYVAGVELAAAEDIDLYKRDGRLGGSESKRFDGNWKRFQRDWRRFDRDWRRISEEENVSVRAVADADLEL